MSHWTIWLLVTSWILTALAQSNFTLSNCVDPSGYSSCLATANSRAYDCVRQNGGNPATCYDPESCFFNEPELEQACGCRSYTEWINCALSFCWNQVYSCAYQALAINGWSTCGLGGESCPPYFPPPANAPGGCSCNFGAVFSSMVEYNNISTQCASRAQQMGSFEFQADCVCCSLSGILSALPDTCPDTDASSIPGWPDNSAVEVGFVGCGYNLETATCTAEPLNLPTPTQAVTPSFYGPGAVPTGGSVSIFDAGGTLSSPISGHILTWSIGNYVTATATAASATISSAAGANGGHKTSSSSRQASVDLRGVFVALATVTYLFHFGQLH